MSDNKEEWNPIKQMIDEAMKVGIKTAKDEAMNTAKEMMKQAISSAGINMKFCDWTSSRSFGRHGAPAKHYFKINGLWYCTDHYRRILEKYANEANKEDNQPSNFAPKPSSMENANTAPQVPLYPVMKPTNPFSNMDAPFTTPVASPVTNPFASPVASQYTTPVASPFITPVTSQYTTPVASPFITPVISQYTTPVASPVTNPFAPSVATQFVPGPLQFSTPVATPVASPVIGPRVSLLDGSTLENVNNNSSSSSSQEAPSATVASSTTSSTTSSAQKHSNEPSDESDEEVPLAKKPRKKFLGLF